MSYHNKYKMSNNLLRYGYGYIEYQNIKKVRYLMIGACPRSLLLYDNITRIGCIHYAIRIIFYS